jgi:hypothetical protein
MDHAAAENNCVVCADALQSAAAYTLPECGHAFHTACIMTWFRANQTRCPLCNAEPVQYSGNNNEVYRQAMRVLKRKREFSQVLKDQLGRIDKIRAKRRELNSQLRQLKSLKLTDSRKAFESKATCKDVLSRIRKLHSQMWQTKYKERECRRVLTAMVPVVPLVIPLSQSARLLQQQQQQQHQEQPEMSWTRHRNSGSARLLRAL